MMCKIIKVAGTSLEPCLKDGDFVVVSKTPILLNYVRPGSLVVFHQPGYGTLIKQVGSVASDGRKIMVQGMQPESVDSRIFGAVRLSDVIGVVVWQIRRK